MSGSGEAAFPAPSASPSASPSTLPSAAPQSVAAAEVARRRAEPRQLWRRLVRASARRRDVLGVIAAGGALGSLARWGIGLAWPHAVGEWPWATLVTNLTGCFLIGVLMVLVLEVWPPSRYVRPFFGVGILGGFTTFSTYELDARALLVAGRPAAAGAYLLGSLLAGLIAVWLAAGLARALAVAARRRGTRPSPRRTS